MVISGELSKFHPVISAWFIQKFGQSTVVQEKAWRTIARGEHTLIASPTGSGKTLAALLPCLEQIIRAKRDGQPSKGVQVIYVTPLKALNNDVHHHIELYIEEMEQVAQQLQVEWPSIYAAVRTGDTTSSTRASMLRRPPDLLITTPESLNILLTSKKARDILRNVQQVIVDEIHDLAASRRGSHLSITLERLVAWCGTPIQRIGVSATQKPIERVARFLGGWDDNDSPRPVAIVENRTHKELQLQVILPKFKISSDRDSIWTPIIEQIMKLIEDCTTVIIFVNNRRLCERLALRINDHVGYELARSHHGSVSKEHRLEVEQLLKTGELRCLIATSSLELGIDIGHIDLVIQMDSPKQVATGIQRIGRAGHQVDEVSRGVIIVRNRAELPEAAVLARLIHDRHIEPIRFPRYILDVISQQVVAMVACDDWTVQQIHSVLSRSDSYRGYSLDQLTAMVRVLAGLYPFIRPLIDWDEESDVLSARKNTSMAALMGSGTIQQGSNYPVHHADSRVHIGELDEEYVHESRVGDVFQLGVSSWRIHSITNHHVYVTESRNQFSEIPFWKGETIGRSYVLGEQLTGWIATIANRLHSSDADEVSSWLQNDAYLDPYSADELTKMVRVQLRMSAVPTRDQLVIETFEDELQYTHVLIHSLYGRRLNRTWMLALRHILDGQVRGRYYAYSKDDGIEFVFPEWDPAILTSLTRLSGDQLESILMEVIPSLPQFGMTFRRMAETSLLLMRSYQRTPAALQRLRSEELLQASLPYAEQFPLIHEAMQACLYEQMDITQLRQILHAIHHGEMRIVIRSLRYPSPFARSLMSDVIEGKLYEGESISKELQLQLMSIHRDMAVEWFGQQAVGAVITPEVIEEEKARLAAYDRETDLASEDSIYQYLKRNGDSSAQEIGRIFGESTLQELHARGRVVAIPLAGAVRYICRDEESIYKTLHEDDLSRFFVLSRYIETMLAFTEQDLADRYGLEHTQITTFIDRCQEQSLIEEAPDQLQNGESAWISRHILSRMIRRSVRSFQEESGPAHAGQILRSSMTRQHVWPNSHLSGTEGLKRVIATLQGVFLPWSQWETHIFPTRIHDYRKQDLDMLCSSGEVIWMGKKQPEEKEGRVAFFLTETNLHASYVMHTAEPKHPKLLQLLEEKGAAFLTAIARELDSPPTEVLDMLFDLVWEGIVSNDQFAPLRQRYQKKSRSTRPAHSGFGRWYRLDQGSDEDARSSMSWIQQHMKRVGLISKSTVNEYDPYAWDVILEQLKQLESWGMLVRGFFVEGIPSIQFAMKEDIEQLRTVEHAVIEYGVEDDGQLVVLPSTDPANPYGAFIPWPSSNQSKASFARKSGNYMVIYKGQWILWIENNGKRVYELEDGILQKRLIDTMDIVGVIRHSFKRMMALSGLRKLSIERWNGRNIQESPAAEYFKQLGAEKDRSHLVLWSSFQ